MDVRSARRWAAHCDVDYAVHPMVVLPCTRKLLARLKRTEVSADIVSSTRLGDWYGNILQIGRRQHLLFISERSRLPIVIPIREGDQFEQSVKGQWRKRQGRATFDFRGEGMRHN